MEVLIPSMAHSCWSRLTPTYHRVFLRVVKDKNSLFRVAVSVIEFVGVFECRIESWYGID